MLRKILDQTRYMRKWNQESLAGGRTEYSTSSWIKNLKYKFFNIDFFISIAAHNYSTFTYSEGSLRKIKGKKKSGKAFCSYRYVFLEHQLNCFNYRFYVPFKHFSIVVMLARKWHHPKCIPWIQILICMQELSYDFMPDCPYLNLPVTNFNC